jgi:hypothetical protein
MFRHIRNIAAAVVTATVLVTGATPALAFKDEGLAATERHTPIFIDAIVLRPMGLMMTAGGIVIGALPTAFVAITRPTDIGKSLNYWVGTPFRYTFMDPLGQHSPVGMMDH